MAENKKSFVLYTDIWSTIKFLNDDQAGKLFKHILKYVNDEDPEAEDLVTQISFEPIRQQLKRDLEKWHGMKNDRSESGQLGNLKRWNPDLYKDVISGVKTLKQSQEIAKDRLAIKKIPNVAVNVNVNANANVNDINKRKGDFKKSALRFNDLYSVKTIHDFVGYWTEHNEKGKLMRFEMKKNQPFNMKRRLGTWFKNSEIWKKEKTSEKKEKINAGKLIQKKYGLS